MEITSNDLKTLAQLLDRNVEFGSDDFPLVIRCKKAASKPLISLTIEDLRLLIGQGMGQKYLLPYAMRYLKADIFCEGDYYPGDLLWVVLAIPVEVWTSCPEEASEMKSLYSNFCNRLFDEDWMGEKKQMEFTEAFRRLMGEEI